MASSPASVQVARVCEDELRGERAKRSEDRVNLPDPVPLGVAGVVTSPRDRYVAEVGPTARRDLVLLTDAERLTYVSGRLAQALDRPLTSPGSEGLARSVLERFGPTDVLMAFAEKGLETLKDGRMHNRTAVSPDPPRVAALFVAWNGTHREMQPERFGNYLGPLMATAHGITQRAVELAGFLEIDAYLRDNADAAQPALALDTLFEVDVELSFVPGAFLGYPAQKPNPLPKVALLNPDLCSPEELQLLRRLRA
jgi:hypothetical protein